MRVLITDKTHNCLIEGLNAMGYQCDIKEGVSQEEFVSLLSDYSGIIVRSRIKVDEAALDAASNLKFVGRLGSGMENIDVAFAEEKNIACFRSPEGNRDGVAEHSLSLLLAMLKNIVTSNTEIHNGEWRRQQNRATELCEMTVGLIGYGNTGKAFAKLLNPFGCKVLAYDKYLEDCGDEYAGEAEMLEIYSKCDIVSLHIPLSSETEFMVNAAFLNQFKKPIYLINTSRGKIVKTNDLIDAIGHGIVLMAALDVLEEEDFEKLNSAKPLWYNRLKASNEIILTPHIAGITNQSEKKMAKTLLKKIETVK